MIGHIKISHAYFGQDLHRNNNVYTETHEQCLKHAKSQLPNYKSIVLSF